jgi:hypothetical protein
MAQSKGVDDTDLVRHLWLRLKAGSDPQILTRRNGLKIRAKTIEATKK